MRLPRWEPGLIEGEWRLVFPGGFVLVMGPEDRAPEHGPVGKGRQPRDGNPSDAEDPGPG